MVVLRSELKIKTTYFDPTVLVDFSTFTWWSSGRGQNVEKGGRIFAIELAAR